MSTQETTAPLLPGSPKSHKRGHGGLRQVTLIPLITIIFFEVSGGPFGTEDAVSAAGPLLTILGFIIFPFLWSIPEALITAELATAFPENSGYVAWVTAAFGPFWGFQEGLWSWLSGVTDNSLYPVMLAANLQLFIPQLQEEGWIRNLFLVGMCFLLSWLNYRGLTVVGLTAVTSGLLVLSPFVVLVALCIPRMQWGNLTQVDVKTVDWPTFLNVMFWNLNYWDGVSTLAGEVHSPARTLPRALLLAVLLVVLSYLLPLAASLGVLGVEGDWALGYFATVAETVGGKWLALWVMAAAAASQVGQYQAEMASDSYQVMGMAERGFLPKVLGLKSRHGTPTIGILLSSLGVLMLATMSFTEIVTLLNAVYCMAELLEFAAILKLRYSAPDLHRPYKIPLPLWGLALMLLPASLLLLTVLAVPFVTGDVRTCLWTGGAVLLGLVLYPLLEIARARGWLEFNERHFDCYDVDVASNFSYSTIVSRTDSAASCSSAAVADGAASFPAPADGAAAAVPFPASGDAKVKNVGLVFAAVRREVTAAVDEEFGQMVEASAFASPPLVPAEEEQRAVAGGGGGFDDAAKLLDEQLHVAGGGRQETRGHPEDAAAGHLTFIGQPEAAAAAAAGHGHGHGHSHGHGHGHGHGHRHGHNQDHGQGHILSAAAAARGGDVENGHCASAVL